MISARVEASEAFREFAHQLREGEVKHSYLFLGRDALARSAFASGFARVLLCPRGGCGECPVCIKLENDSHPDVETLNLDGKFKVADVEEWTERAYLKGVESERKIYFIEHANRLTPAVQNKMLKLTEEPPAGVVIVLLASSEVGLLPTLISRAEKRFIPLFSSEEVYEELAERGVERPVALSAAALGGGRFDLALRFAEEEGAEARYEDALEILLKCKRTSDVVKFYRSEAFSKEQIGLTLDFMEIILNDVLTFVSGAARPYRTHNRDYAIKEISKGFSPAGVAMALVAFVEARNKLAVNVGAEAVAEQLLFGILEAKYKWQS